MTMKMIKTLFSQRRWMPWLPVPASIWLTAPDWHHVPATLVGGCIVWIPFWLAWWLSDGFEGMSQWPGTGAPNTTAGVNPFTGKSCVVHHLPWGDTYTGGNS